MLSFKMKSLDGEEVDLAKYEGKVVMIVNVASKCGYTGQYEQLQQLHEKYSGQGLAILGFPCNQFLGQEPGSAEEIRRSAGELRRDVRPVRQGRGQWRERLRPVQVPDVTGHEAQGARQDRLELREILDRSQRKGGRSVWLRHEAGCPEVVAIIERELAKTAGMEGDSQKTTSSADMTIAGVRSLPSGSLRVLIADVIAFVHRLQGPATPPVRFPERRLRWVGRVAIGTECWAKSGASARARPPTRIFTTAPCSPSARPGWSPSA